VSDTSEGSSIRNFGSNIFIKQFSGSISNGITTSASSSTVLLQNRLLSPILKRKIASPTGHALCMGAITKLYAIKNGKSSKSTQHTQGQLMVPGSII
jgi:hypothetical protein